MASLTKLSKMDAAISYMMQNYADFNGEQTAETIGELRNNLCSLVEELNDRAGDMYELFMLDSNLTSYLDIHNYEPRSTPLKENITLDEFDKLRCGEVS